MTSLSCQLSVMRASSQMVVLRCCGLWREESMECVRWIVQNLAEQPVVGLVQQLLRIRQIRRTVATTFTLVPDWSLVQYWLISTSWTTHHHCTQYGVCERHQPVVHGQCLLPVIVSMAFEVFNWSGQRLRKIWHFQKMRKSNVDKIAEANGR